MRDITRINRISEKLAIIWNHEPDLRFFQLLDMIGFDGHTDYFYLEDDKLEEALNQYITSHYKN